MRDCEHVVIETKTGRVVCKHCGSSYNHNGMLPAPVAFVNKVMELFLEMHEGCPPRVRVRREENTDGVDFAD